MQNLSFPQTTWFNTFTNKNAILILSYFFQVDILAKNYPLIYYHSDHCIYRTPWFITYIKSTTNIKSMTSSVGIAGMIIINCRASTTIIL